MPLLRPRLPRGIAQGPCAQRTRRRRLCKAAAGSYCRGGRTTRVLADGDWTQRLLLLRRPFLLLAPRLPTESNHTTSLCRSATSSIVRLLGSISEPETYLMTYLGLVHEKNFRPLLGPSLFTVSNLLGAAQLQSGCKPTPTAPEESAAVGSEPPKPNPPAPPRAAPRPPEPASVDVEFAAAACVALRLPASAA